MQIYSRKVDEDEPTSRRAMYVESTKSNGNA